MILEVDFSSDTTFDGEFGEVYQTGGGEDDTQTYILVTEDGREIPAILVDELTVFDATANDIRLGKTAATESGVTIGEKVIPSYHTWQGTQLIPSGQALIIKNRNQQIPYHNYTKLQSIICSFNTSLSNSVSTNKVSIEDDVYDVLSLTSISKIIKDSDNTSIDFGIVNDSDKPCVIRFFTYKEIY